MLDWIFQDDVEFEQIAKQCRKSVGAVRKWAYGERRPQLMSAVQIERMSKGKVLPRHFIEAMER